MGLLSIFLLKWGIYDFFVFWPLLKKNREMNMANFFPNLVLLSRFIRINATYEGVASFALAR
jgi:hypothetical protein